MVAVLRFQERQARERYRLRLAERTRIAREMHDTVVQGCVGVSTLIEAAVGSARSDQDLMLECLDNARIHLRLTLGRSAAGALGPAPRLVRARTARRALGTGADGRAREKQTPVTLEVEGAAVRLADATNRTLLLVAREAIRNAVMHAAPTEVRVRLSFGPSSIRLEVQDNGRGLPSGGGAAGGCRPLRDPGNAGEDGADLRIAGSDEQPGEGRHGDRALAARTGRRPPHDDAARADRRACSRGPYSGRPQDEFVCPMDPGGAIGKPGRCPRCGMTLVADCRIPPSIRLSAAARSGGAASRDGGCSSLSRCGTRRPVRA